MIESCYNHGCLKMKSDLKGRLEKFGNSNNLN